MRTGTIFVGLDVDKEHIAACVLRGTQAPPLAEVRLPNEEKRLRKFLRSYARQAMLQVGYEAGFSGYGLARALRAWGYDGRVIAPSTVARPAKERQKKTNKKDALRLAKAMAAGDVSYVEVPEEEREAHRDQVRLWMALRKDEKRIKARLNGFLHLRGCVYREGKTLWTVRHLRWIQSLPLAPEDASTVNTYRQTMVFLETQRAVVMEELVRLAVHPSYRAAVGRLRCFKGVDLLTALALVLEIGSFRRFPTAQKFMDYLGLVPSEHTTGDTRRDGPVTGAGNARLRRLLIEAAWHYTHRPSYCKALIQRQQGQPMEVAAHAAKAHVRLYRRYSYLRRSHLKGVAIVAIARELAGFLWAVMQ
jgi:transposase